MHHASLILLILATSLVFMGLVPCFGWMNWASGPVCSLTVLLGVIGLTMDKDEQSGEARHTGIHLAALIGGTVLGVVATLRCLIGGGML